ncbi:methyl-accepting chemotaxis protein [Aquitalea magnusonii]|uniref:Methyl-accepting chemotaxis protein n=1 Tax=Aquitalea magnusonii TaxID=332411 RepID=A0A3G9GBL7_9NEIS|nr:PAS domain-containing methyl-accepting chemotaxis protein [Aquitalea magnusonii]BBF84855.1 methyl-accepting chemotaxis protein [Aquitalea magnusonii]
MINEATARISEALRICGGEASSELRDISEFFKAINRNQAIVEFDLHGIIVEANDNFLRLFGFKRDMLIGKHHHAIWIESQVNSGEYDALWKALCNGEAVSGEFHRKKASGEDIYIQAYYNPLLNEDGAPYRIIKFTADITARKKAQHEDQGKVAAVEQSQCVIEFDLDGRIVAVNDIFLRLMGYSHEGVIGQHHSMFCPVEVSQSDSYESFWNALRDGRAQCGEFQRLNHRHQPVWLQATYTPILGLDGKPFKVVKYATDITAAKEKALEDEGKVNAISRSQGVIEFDMAGIVQQANQNFLKLMGYELDEIKGQHHRLFVTEEEAESPAYRAFWQKMNKGEFDAGEYLRIGKNGKRIWIQATYNPIFDLEGKPVKVVKYCSDITSEKQDAQENRSRLKAVSESLCYAELDRESNFIQCNEQLCQVLGYTHSEMLGKGLQKLLFEEDQGSAANQDIWRELHRGHVYCGEMRVQAAGRQEVWISLNLTPVTGLAGELSKVILLARDITKEKLERLETEGKLSAINRAQAVIEFDLSGKVLGANDNFLALMGYRLEQIQGMHHRMFVDPQEISKADYQNFWERLARGEFFSGEYKRIANGGKEVWIQATYNPVLNPSGQPIKVVKIASDITQAKLHNAEYRAKVDAINAGQAMVEFDLQGNILTANRNFLAAMGYTLREIQGHHHSIFCTAEYTHSAEYRDFWLSLSEGKFVSGRFHRVGKFSRDVWIQATYNPILDLNGAVCKIIKYAYDVTKEVQMEREISQKSREMADSVSILVESINMVATLSGQASVLSGQAASVASEGSQALEQSLQLIAKIRRSADRIAEIVGVISEIANQTNLLAFNAAIEAARAGQHGVGFSVVAAEVRKLAERCSKAAQEITEQVQLADGQVDQGIEASQRAASNFKGIHHGVEQTASSIQEIVDVTRRQAELTTEVKHLITSLARNSGNTGSN